MTENHERCEVISIRKITQFVDANYRPPAPDIFCADVAFWLGLNLVYWAIWLNGAETLVSGSLETRATLILGCTSLVFVSLLASRGIYYHRVLPSMIQVWISAEHQGDPYTPILGTISNLAEKINDHS